MPRPAVSHPQLKKAAQPLFAVARLLGFMACLALTLTGILGGASPALAQLAGVTEFDITEVAPGENLFPATPFADPCDPNPAEFVGCIGGNINVTFGAAGGRGNVVLNAVIAAGSRFEPATDLLPPLGLVPRLEFRRSTSPTLLDRQLLFFELNNLAAGDLTIAPSSVGTIEEAMLSSVINRGIDNVFNNDPEIGGAGDGTGQETGNNIERIDYIIDGGVTVQVANQGDVGFLIIERGAAGGSDPFRIAAITELTGGLPSNYGPVVNVVAADWGPGANIPLSSVVFREDPGVVGFRPAHFPAPNQSVRGIYIPINALVAAPQNTAPIFGYSLFAPDVNATGVQLIDFDNPAFFRIDTNNTLGGLDLIAGGFGLIRRTTIAPAGSLSLLKRITNLFGPANLPNFNQFVGDGAALTLLQNNNLGQGLDVITDPAVQAGNGIEYTVYFANSGLGAAPNVVLCDQIPVGLTFAPNGYGPGLGIQAIAASSPPGPVVNYTNAADGDPGTFFAPGAALPPFCGTNQGNGAVVVNAANVAANQVGFIRFRTTVD